MADDTKHRGMGSSISKKDTDTSVLNKLESKEATQPESMTEGERAELKRLRELAQAAAAARKGAGQAALEK